MFEPSDIAAYREYAPCEKTDICARGQETIDPDGPPPDFRKPIVELLAGGKAAWIEA
jgi:hypothetical protein